MKRELQIIAEELARLKSEGVSVVNVSDETLELLRQRAKSLSKVPAPAPDAASSPSAGAAASEERLKALLGETGPLPDFNPKPVVPARAKAARTLPKPPVVQLPAGDKKARWEALRTQVLECPICAAQTKPGCRVVFGTGNLDAEIFFIGEAPGADEEISGEPFVGEAGMLLTKMIGAMGLNREMVYIANIMNWRPPTPTGNRPPTQEEVEFCLPYLLAQLEIVQPKVIVALGATALAGLFGADHKRRLRDLRGEWMDHRGTPTMVTYHPSYLIRNGSNQVKRTVWEDLLKVMERVGLPIDEKQRSFFLPRP